MKPIIAVVALLAEAGGSEVSKRECSGSKP